MSNIIASEIVEMVAEGTQNPAAIFDVLLKEKGIVYSSGCSIIDLDVEDGEAVVSLVDYDTDTDLKKFKIKLVIEEIKE